MIFKPTSNKPVKLFISQPMKDKTYEEILSEREKAVKFVKEKFNVDVEVIDTYIKENLTPLGYIAKSIELMSEADFVYFAPGWRKARGCLIEHECAVQYGLSYYDGQ